MTKILSLISPEVVCQASDRLVSLSTRRDFTPFDRRANKTLVLGTRDAIAFISYAGEAYLDGIPTDEWIARVITGNKRVTASSGEVGAATWKGTLFTTGRLPLFDIGQTALILARELERTRTGVTARERRKLGPWLIIAALRWKLRRPMFVLPFAATVEPRPPDGRYVASFPRAWEGKSPYFLIYETPLPTDFAGRKLDVTSILSGWDTPEAVEDGLVTAIRSAAERSPTRIGKDCVTVSATNDPLGLIRVRFHPADESSFTLRGAGSQTIPVAYTPWLIGPKVASPPQETLGPNDLRMGLVQIGDEVAELRAEIEAPKAPGGRWGTRTAYRTRPPGEQY